MAQMISEQGEQRALLRARRAAEAAEEEDRRLEERRRQWQREGAYLSRAELEAGELCRGCGQPLLDGLGGWYPLKLNQLTPEQRAEYDRADVLFRDRHGDCRSHRWSLSGHRATHCGYCCPPPPLSDRQIEQIAQILSSARVRTQDLDAWDLTLTCEHVVRRTQHRDHDRYTPAVTDCPACGTRRGVVIAQRVGPADDRNRQVVRDRLVGELAAAQAKLDRQRKAIKATERGIAVHDYPAQAGSGRHLSWPIPARLDAEGASSASVQARRCVRLGGEGTYARLPSGR